jgi:F0F1-type ATP synthase membrane subunit b/b'
MGRVPAMSDTEGVDADDVQRANEAAEAEFEQAREEIEEQVESITEQVNRALDEDREPDAGA